MEILSPSASVETIKNQKGPAVTPKRKRMVNVLDVLETIKSSSTTPKKTVAISEAKTEISDTKAPEQETETEAGPLEPTKVKSLEIEEEKITEPILVEEISVVAPEASFEAFDYIIRHASGKKMTEKEQQEAQTSGVLSPAADIETVKNQKVPAMTPKRKRMANVLDVLETIKSSSTTPKKTVETSEAETEIFDTKAPKQQTETEAGP